VPNDKDATSAPRRRQRPANPNQDPSLLRQNQEDLKQRTGSFPALTELIGSSSGLQGMRRPAQPVAGDPSASALGLSPPSPLGETSADEQGVRDEHSVLDQAVSDLPQPEVPEEAPALEVGTPAGPVIGSQQSAPASAAGVTPERASIAAAHARAPTGRHPLLYVALGILTGVLLILAISYLWRSNAGAPAPGAAPSPIVPRHEAGPQAPIAPTTPNAPPSAPVAASDLNTPAATAPALVPETLPAAALAPPASSQPASEPASEPAPAATSQPASEPAAAAP
jgi:hypothetical protein